jgi:hypothetical protein
MSQGDFFRTPEEELNRLNTELAELRELMRDVAGRLNQIERHVKRAFGVKQTPRASGKQKESQQGATISPDEALNQFRELTDLSREGGSDAVEHRLAQMSIANLKVMAHELGVSFPSKPNRKNLQAGIRGRISESVMLTQNRNIMSPTAKTDAEGGADEPNSATKDESPEQ